MELVNIILSVSNIVTGLIIVAISIPLYKGKIKPNHYYGMRTKKAFESEENWYKINKFGAREMIYWSIPIFAAGVFALFAPLTEDSSLTMMIAFAPLLIAIPCVKTWKYGKSL